MARKTFYEILKELTPESTGNEPINVSMPLLYYHLGQYHIVSFVTGGQNGGPFAHKNRNADRIVGVAFYHPEQKTGEYLSVSRAKEKYGLNLTHLASRGAGLLSADQTDGEVKLPAKLKKDAAELYYNNRITLEAYNAHVMLAAAQNPNDTRRYLAFKLNPDEVPHMPKPQHHQIFMLRVFVVALIICFLILSRGIYNSYSKISELQTKNETLARQNNQLRHTAAVTEASHYIANGTYEINQAIPSDTHNGNISDHVRGKQDSNVIMIAYVDFQCPGCASAWPAFQQLYEEYSDRVTFIQRNYPLNFHENATMAARAAEAAGRQGYYWEMSDLLFSKQSGWSELSDQRFRSYLIEQFAKVAPEGDADVFAAALESEDIFNKVAFDYALGATAHNVGYTPTIYVNGVKVDFSEAGENDTVYELIAAAIKKALAN